ncbi:hypothetical protein AJ79_04866 [Helicocarpus griseus UAMH5409]|uniref:Uncharacterized protein n=1 Tax=Helicocarpus griseus UAMH5409 TaxID=1447875 RepID=A0A2B7XRV1_9EURO|nr:hypothetical protein AJ79_04866 [Helicocarpus griseus UAMH5409]
MRRSRGLASRPLLVFALFFCLVLLIGRVGAQIPDGEGIPLPGDEPSPPEQNPDQPGRQPNPDPTDEPSPTDPLPNDKKPTETQTEDNSQPTDAPTQTKIELPGITTDATTTADDPTKTDSLPSLPPLFQIPTPQVPPGGAAGAPYLQPSTVPEGTIFIAVGAALGVFGLAVFAWRALVAWSINRSVRRAATRPNQTDATALLSKRKSGVYRQPPGASMSMEKMGGSSARHSTLPPRTHTPNASLFFSPTAGANMHAASGNRGSSYLPAGYYAAGSATPGSGSGMAHAGQSIGLSPLGPQSQGYARTRSTPPASPSLPPTSRGHEQLYPSTSSLNLSAAPQGRAPSAYLEDLFENHHPPGR